MRVKIFTRPDKIKKEGKRKRLNGHRASGRAKSRREKGNHLNAVENNIYNLRLNLKGSYTKLLEVI